MGLYLLIPLSVVLVFIIGVIFWWSVRSGQFDDLEGPAYRMLIDDQDSAKRNPGNAGRDSEASAAVASEESQPAAGDSSNHSGESGKKPANEGE